MRAFVWPILLFCLVGLIVYSVRLSSVTGGSMSPALGEGSRIVVDILTPRLLGINRGDVVVFRNPKDASVTEVKRVIGLPNELVVIEGGTIAVIPKGDKAHVLKQGTPTGGDGHVGDFKIQLGPEDYFMLGDNRNKSTDSRSFGVVHPADIIGRVVYSF